jgi:hypothetical protein
MLLLIRPCFNTPASSASSHVDNTAESKFLQVPRFAPGAAIVSAPGDSSAHPSRPAAAGRLCLIDTKTYD